MSDLADRSGSHSPASVVIELAGLPGAGKTTLASELRQLLGQPESAIASRTPQARLFGWTKTVLRFPGPIWQAARALLGDSRPVGLRVRALRWLITTLQSYPDRPGGRGVTVIDEGSIQRALLLFFDPSSSVAPSSRIDSYVARVPVGDIVVRISVDPKEAARRLTDRGSDPEDRRTNRRFMASGFPPHEVLTRAEAYLDWVISRFVAVRHVEVVGVDSTGEATDQRGRELLARLGLSPGS